MPDRNSIYFILCDFGPKIGREWVARDPGAMDWQSTVEAIASGEYDNAIEIREADGWKDVTREIAQAVSTKWAHSGEPLNYDQYNFVEQTLGTRAARSFLRAA
jgi:hypothetical protein